MEQIVKIFVHQSYFIENDLVVDYNVKQGSHVNVSPKDWIALIPKGWSGVDEQIAFKTVDIDSDIINLAIKSVIIEKKYFEKIVECEKQYQLMYVNQYLEILGRSEFFVFLHQSDKCDCVSSTNTENKENSKQSRLSSAVLSRKPPRRQSPTPREFYKNQVQLQNNLVKSETSKSKQWVTCVKCNASNNFTALESAYLAKIQDLTTHKEKMEKCLTKVENDLIHTLDVIYKLFKLSNAISQQKDNIKKFIDDIVEGLLKDGKITFWAHDQEFSVVREFPDKKQTLLLPDESLPFNKSLNSSKEVYMKAIIGNQEQTIQHLVNKIRDSFDILFQENTLYEKQISNMGYKDSSGTIYYSPPPFITNTLNDINLYSPNNTKNNCIENIDTNENVGNWINNFGYSYKCSDNLGPQKITPLNREVKDKTLTFEERKKDDALYNSCLDKKTNELDFNLKKNDSEESNCSF